MYLIASFHVLTEYMDDRNVIRIKRGLFSTEYIYSLKYSSMGKRTWSELGRPFFS